MRAALEAIDAHDDEGLRDALGDLLGAASFHARARQAWRRHRQRFRLQELAREAVDADNLSAVQRLMPMLGRRARRRVAQQGLHRAAENGYQDLLEFLLRFSDPLPARFYEYATDGTALQKAVRHGQAAIVRTLLPHHLPTGVSLHDALFTAADAGQAPMLDLLLPHVNPNVRGPLGQTPLMVAASKGHLTVVRRLLPLSNPNDQDTRGDTAMMLAALEGHSEVVIALLPHTDPHHRQTNDRTVLHHAAFRGDTVSVQRLIGVCDPHQQDDNGWTPLMCAAGSQTHRTHDALALLLPVSDLRTTDHLGDGAFELALAADRGRTSWPTRPGRWERIDRLAFHEPQRDKVDRAFALGGSERMPAWASHLEREALRATLSAASFPSAVDEGASMTLVRRRL